MTLYVALAYGISAVILLGLLVASQNKEHKDDS